MLHTIQAILKKIKQVLHSANRDILKQFYSYLTARYPSTNHQINNLKVAISFANYIGNLGLRGQIVFHLLTFQIMLPEYELVTKYQLPLARKQASDGQNLKWITLKYPIYS